MRLAPATLLVLAIGLVFGPAASAKSINVSTFADDYGQGAATCSLREAVEAANTDKSFGGCLAGDGADVVRLPSGTYKVTKSGKEAANKAGDINVIGEDLTITPASATGAVTIDAAQKDRALGMTGPGTLTLRGITLRNGSAETGGGVYVWGKGHLSIERSAIIANQAAWGGGVGVADGAEATILNSTIFSNRSTMSGGGVAVGIDGVLTIRSSTIYGNLADSDASGNGNGGGLSLNVGAGTARVTNTILAGNEDLSPANYGMAPDCDTGKSFFPRFVLSTQKIGSGLCLAGSNPANNIHGDPKVTTYGYHGGTTPSLAVADESPAVDSAGKSNPDLCPATDQRGLLRDALACDIGAYEVDPIIFVPHPLPPSDLTTDPPLIGATVLPKVKGWAPAGTTVKVFANSDCSGIPLASGTAAAFTGPGLPVKVAKGSTTTFRAIAMNAQKIDSACSSSSATYTQDEGNEGQR